jgi:hypothetical protein
MDTFQDVPREVSCALGGHKVGDGSSAIDVRERGAHDLLHLARVDVDARPEAHGAAELVSLADCQNTNPAFCGPHSRTS